MTLNIIAYGIYTLITAFIVLRVGWVFYVNGAHYLYEVFEDDRPIADRLNFMLLVGYYLVNLGYVAFSIGFWPRITDTLELIELLAERTAWITISLAVMHYLNMIWVRLAKNLFKHN